MRWHIYTLRVSGVVGAISLISAVWLAWSPLVWQREIKKESKLEAALCSWFACLWLFACGCTLIRWALPAEFEVLEIPVEQPIENPRGTGESESLLYTDRGLSVVSIAPHRAESQKPSPHHRLSPTGYGATNDASTIDTSVPTSFPTAPSPTRVVVSPINPLPTVPPPTGRGSRPLWRATFRGLACIAMSGGCFGWATLMHSYGVAKLVVAPAAVGATLYVAASFHILVSFMFFVSAYKEHTRRERLSHIAYELI